MENDWAALDMETSPFVAYPHTLSRMICHTDFSPHEGRVFAFVVRKTFGYRKQRDKISLSQFEGGTGIERRRAHEAIQRLLARKILCRQPAKPRTVKTYWINTNFSEWQRRKRTNLSPADGIDSSVALTQDSLSHLGGTELSHAGGTNLSHPCALTKEIKESKKTLKESAVPQRLVRVGRTDADDRDLERDRRTQVRKAFLEKQFQSLVDAKTMDTKKAVQ